MEREKKGREKEEEKKKGGGREGEGKEEGWEDGRDLRRERIGKRSGEERGTVFPQIILLSQYLPKETQIYRQWNLWADGIPRIHLQLSSLKSKHIPLL